MRPTLLHVLLFFVLLLSLFVSGFGFFTTAVPAPYEFINQFGDTVKMYGSGIYARDSFLRAPIFRGTDFTIFFIACPLLLTAIVLDLRHRSIRTTLSLISLTGVFLYYATSIAFGITYNDLHLAYILLFSISFFALITGLRQFDYDALEKAICSDLPHKGIFAFLSITGVALFAAWLPDILSSLSKGHPPVTIETYTTEITNVLDMGVIAPLCFICLYQIRKKKAIGYVLLDLLLTLCIIIGVMLPIQTLYQTYVGISLPMAALATKMGSFCLLALFALYFKWRLLRSLHTQKKTYGAPQTSPYHIF